MNDTNAVDAEARRLALALSSHFGRSLDSLWAAEEGLRGLVSPHHVGYLTELAGTCTERALAECVISLIRHIRAPYDAAKLTELFDCAADEILRWRIADTFELSRPANIAPWLAERIRDPSIGKSKEMLLLAAAKHLPRPQAAALCREVFEEHPGHAAITLGKTGSIEDIPFLEQKLEEAIRLKRYTWIKNEIKSAMKRIRKRAGLL